MAVNTDEARIIALINKVDELSREVLKLREEIGKIEIPEESEDYSYDIDFLGRAIRRVEGRIDKLEHLHEA